MNLLEPLLTLSSATERHKWLLNHYPTKDQVLIQDLWSMAEQRERHDPHTIVPVIEAAEAMAEVWEDPQMTAAALRIAASMQRAMGDHVQALTLYQAAIDLYQSLDLELEAARAAVGPLDTLRYLGQYHEGLKLADWAIAQLRRTDDSFTLGKLLVNQGNIFAQLADFPRAQQVYAEARARLAALGHHHHVAVLEVNEANVLTNLNEFRQAEVHFNSAHNYFVSAGLSNTVARIEHNLAYLYYAQGDYQRALTTFDHARKTFVEQESAVDIAFVDLYRSDVYLALTLWSEALSLAQSARKIFEAAQMPWEIGLLWLNEAVASAHMDEPTAATQAFSHARQLFTQTDNQLWSAVTDLYEASFAWQAGQLSTADTYVRRAYSVFQKLAIHTRAAQCAILLGEMALYTNSPTHAIKEFTDGLTYLQGIDLPAINFSCHHGLGRAYLLQNDIGAAMSHYRCAITDLERLQMAIAAEDYKIAFHSDKTHIYEEFITVCLQLDAPDTQQEIFATIQQVKSRLLADALVNDPIDLLPSTEDDLYTAIDALRRELNWYYNRLYIPSMGDNRQALLPDLQLRTKISEREQDLAVLWQRWRQREIATARHPIRSVLTTDIQAHLPAGTLLLEWFTTDHHCVVFGLTHEEMWIRQWELSSRDLMAALQRLHFYIDKLSYGLAYHRRHEQALGQGVDECLHQLYQLLLQPLSNFLLAENLIIAPHGRLHSVPFHALFDGRQYLIETKEVTYIPSATVLYRILTRSTRQPSGPPMIMSITEPSIPYVDVEVARLEKLFPQATIYRDEAATVDRLLMEHVRPSFLHISTHAAFRTDNPRFSALKFTDGWLTINDLDRLKAVADLVTLSACETGRNHVMTGDELMGFWRGFFQAGARSLLVGLWPVADQATAHFMGIFYGALQGGKSVGQALHTAQLELKVAYPHPYYWAPFMLLGDPSFALSDSRL